MIEKLKKDSGVTLSILVITIIVVMILASVTIATSDLLIKDTKEKAMISNMYIVKGKAETFYDNYKFSEINLNSLPGEHLSDSSLNNYFVNHKMYYGIIDGITDSDLNFNLASPSTENEQKIAAEIDIAKDMWFKWDRTVLSNMGIEPTILTGSNVFIVNYYYRRSYLYRWS